MHFDSLGKVQVDSWKKLPLLKRLQFPKLYANEFRDAEKYYHRDSYEPDFEISYMPMVPFDRLPNSLLLGMDLKTLKNIFIHYNHGSDRVDGRLYL